jgi:hypothetical protein
MRYETTNERRANLVKLARFLFTEIPQERFDMGDFASDFDPPQLHSCGAVGCAVGWGPAAGVELLKSEIIQSSESEPCVDCYIDWYQYADRAFGGDRLYDWCFNAGWRPYDNTPSGAAKRILWALTNGIPSHHWGKCGLETYVDWQPTEADWQLAAEATP